MKAAMYSLLALFLDCVKVKDWTVPDAEYAKASQRL